MPSATVIRIDRETPLETWPDFPESEISSGTRASRGKMLLEDAAVGLRIGLWEAEANLGRWMDWPCDEFMVILEGEVVMVEADRETVIGPGECFFIPKGRRCIWNQAGYVKKIMVLFDVSPGQPAPEAQRIRMIDPATPLAPIPAPDAAILLSATPTQQACTVTSDASGQLTVGLWQSTAYERIPVTAPHHEVMHLLEGSMTLTDGVGRSQTFGPGETLLVPLGTQNAWKSTGTVRKIFCSIKPLT